MNKPKKQPVLNPKTVTLPHPSYQPTKAEMQKRIKLDVPGRTLDEKASNFAQALMRPAKIQYQQKK